MTISIKNILAELRHHLERLYGPRLSSVWLYGSQARGDAQSESDLDILVVLDGHVNPGEEIKRTGGFVSDLSLRNNVVLSCLFVSADRYATEQSPILLNVRREGVAV